MALRALSSSWESSMASLLSRLPTPPVPLMSPPPPIAGNPWWQNDKGGIVLRFVPMDASKEETILVKLTEEASGIEYTAKVNATWS